MVLRVRTPTRASPGPSHTLAARVPQARGEPSPASGAAAPLGSGPFPHPWSHPRSQHRAVPQPLVPVTAQEGPCQPEGPPGYPRAPLSCPRSLTTSAEFLRHTRSPSFRFWGSGRGHLEGTALRPPPVTKTPGTCQSPPRLRPGVPLALCLLAGDHGGRPVSCPTFPQHRELPATPRPPREASGALWASKSSQRTFRGEGGIGQSTRGHVHLGGPRGLTPSARSCARRGRAPRVELSASREPALHPESLVSGWAWPQAPRSFFGSLGVPRPGARHRCRRRPRLVSEVVHPTGLCGAPAARQPRTGFGGTVSPP